MSTILRYKAAPFKDASRFPHHCLSFSGFDLGVVEYGAVMEALEQSGKPERSLEIFDEMVNLLYHNAKTSSLEDVSMRLGLSLRVPV